MSKPSTVTNKTKSRRIALVILTCVLLVVGIVAVVFSLLIANNQSEGPIPNREPVVEAISFFGESIPIIEDVDKNEYDVECFAFNDSGFMVYDSRDYETFTGVDVSTFQDYIDWEAVKADGIDFAIIRVGFRGYSLGQITTDNRFYQNINGAMEAGVDIGVYFFSQAITEQEAVEEAEWVLNMIKNYDITYPIVFDWEYHGIEGERTEPVQDSSIGAFANAFCQVIEQAGYTPMIYFNRDLAYRYYDLAEIDGYDFWVAEYNEAPTFYYDFEMLQYTNKGAVNGIGPDVDLNLCFKNYAAG